MQSDKYDDKYDDKYNGDYCAQIFSTNWVRVRVRVSSEGKLTNSQNYAFNSSYTNNATSDSNTGYYSNVCDSCWGKTRIRFVLVYLMWGYCQN